MIIFYRIFTENIGRKHFQSKEMGEEENWRNQTIKGKERNRTSTLETNRDWLRVNLKTARPKLPIGILKNGHRKGLQTIAIGENKYTLSNTCAFDSFKQLLYVSFSDSDAYRQYLEAPTTFLRET